MKGLGLRRLPHVGRGLRRSSNEHLAVAEATGPFDRARELSGRPKGYGHHRTATAVALTQRRAPVAQGIGAAVSVRGSSHRDLPLVFAHSYLVGTGQAREASEVKSKKQGQEAHRGKGS